MQLYSSSNESDDGDDDASLVRHGITRYPFWKMEVRTLSTQVIANATISFFLFFGLLVVDEKGAEVVGMKGTLHDEGRALTLLPSEQVASWK